MAGTKVVETIVLKTSVDAPLACKRNLLDGAAHKTRCCHLSGPYCETFFAGPYGNRRPEPKQGSVLCALNLYLAFRSRLIDCAPYHPFDLPCINGTE